MVFCRVSCQHIQQNSLYHSLFSFYRQAVKKPSPNLIPASCQIKSMNRYLSLMLKHIKLIIISDWGQIFRSYFFSKSSGDRSSLKRYSMMFQTRYRDGTESKIFKLWPAILYLWARSWLKKYSALIAWKIGWFHSKLSYCTNYVSH